MEKHSPISGIAWVEKLITKIKILSLFTVSFSKNVTIILQIKLTAVQMFKID